MRPASGRNRLDVLPKTACGWRVQRNTNAKQTSRASGGADSRRVFAASRNPRRAPAATARHRKSLQRLADRAVGRSFTRRLPAGTCGHRGRPPWTGPAVAPTIGPEGIRRAAVTGPGFVHLHVHSSYSLLEGALPIGKLAELAKADRQP